MIYCREGCNREYTGTTKNLKSFVCANCTQNLINQFANPQVEGEVTPKRKATPRKLEVRYVKGKPGFPIGWHRRKNFVHPDGATYERGVLVV